jgi:Leucine-rich repeat (LRR) protein
MLTELPRTIGGLISLEYLMLHSNFIATLPFGIGTCTKLQSMDLSVNELIELPDEFRYASLYIVAMLSSTIR